MTLDNGTNVVNLNFTDKAGNTATEYILPIADLTPAEIVLSGVEEGVTW